MEFLIPSLLLLAGAVLLFAGAEGLVRGGSDLALRLGLPKIVIGLTVVAYGTSLPEFAVSSLAAWRGSPELALGNVLGSNICNIALILGVGIMLRPIRVPSAVVRREVPLLATLSVILVACLWDGGVTRSEGAVLFLAGPLLTADLWRRASREPLHEPAVVPSVGGRPLPLAVAMIVGGLAAMVAGGELFVGGAIDLARLFGISERVIALTVVALGTSLPELMTIVVAQLRGEAEIGVGNIVGSNFFNLSFVFGGAALIAPMEIGSGSLSSDLALALLLPLVLVAHRPGSRRMLGRLRGGGLILIYTGYTLLLLLGGRVGL